MADFILACVAVVCFLISMPLVWYAARHKRSREDIAWMYITWTMAIAGASTWIYIALHHLPN